MPAAVSARRAQPEKKSHKTTKVVKPTKRAPETALEMTIAFQMRAARLPDPEWGYKWHPKRFWRSDAAWPQRTPVVILEVEGSVTPFRDKYTGQLRQGRHNSITGFENDCIKYSEAAILGHCLIRVTRRMIDDGRALALIERALAASH